jgi:hypothetical protein
LLPDDALLEIFHFYQDKYEYTDEGEIIKEEVETWQSLVHVCRRWRRIVFESPHRLYLRLVCTSKTPAKDTLDTWPALPIHIWDKDFISEGVDNIVAALEYSDRVDKIGLSEVGGPPMGSVLMAMQKPFPELTRLELHSDGAVTVIPDAFLDGYAPNLEYLKLDHIPIPRLPSLLTHSIDLFSIYLLNIPHSGYFSPEEMVSCLSTLKELQEFVLEFESPLSRPVRARRRPPPSVLPVLTELDFKGVSEYSEDLVARIVAPQLRWLNITFFNQIDFDAPQLVQFVSRTPKLKALEKARLALGADDAAVNLSSMTTRDEQFDLNILCRELDWQVSCLEQLCTSFFPSIFTPEDLYIYQKKDSEPDWKDNVENAMWLTLLRPLTSVKNLYLSKEFAPHITPPLQELIGGRTTEVLPILQSIFLEELQPSGSAVQKAIETFVGARQLSGHPVTVSRWERDSEGEGYFGP